MQNSFLLLLTIVFSFLVACNNNEDTDVVLRKPPYNDLTDSIKQSPEDGNLYFQRGILLYQNKQARLAEYDLKKAWALQQNEDYAISLATLLRNKHPDSALLFLRGATEKLPNSISLKLTMAKTYQQKNDLADALSILDQILKKTPNQVDALLLKSEILKSLNRDAEALNTLERAYTYAPFDVEIANNLAFEYAEAKNPKVLKLSDSLVAMDMSETHAEPFYFKALYYSNTNNYSEAVRLLNQAIQRDYYFLDAYMEKGQIFYKQKKYNEAMKVFQLANTISPAFADAYYWLGKCKQALGKKEEAKLDYQRAYGLDKSLTEAKEAAESL
jgi:tetratricopeptide (TPR) repeat protein